MPILQDIPVALTAREIVAERGRKDVSSALLADAEEAIALGQTLWQPVAVYDWFEVCDRHGEYVSISPAGDSHSESVLHVGPKADLLAEARRVLISVVSIGLLLERRVRELQSGREHLKAYLLDNAGVVALGAAGEAMRCVAEEAAAGLGWGVSPSLSPGSLVGWSLRGQRELCALLPLHEVGVVLNDHYVLVPQKSASSLIGLGPGYDSAHVGSVCKYCALQDTCWRRREEHS
jgi:hypothetical protein